ncbi:MAG TPA: hypothetical protein DCQ53_00970, partial [Alphaproteobacteria bacterium]|nr:hypothetical protein [Alphaproteobacteria bacterium]
DAAAAQGAVAADAHNTTMTASTLSGTFINGSAETGVTALDPSTVDPWFTSTSYIGAVQNNQDRWWAGWTCGLEATSPC